MAVFIFIGWLVGLVVAALVGMVSLVAFGLTVPALLVPLSASVAAIIAPLGPLLAAILALIALIIAYLLAYRSATLAIAPQLPPLQDPTDPFATLTGTATTVPATNGEYFGRGLMIGLTAGLNFLALNLVPVGGMLLAPWAFALISLGALPPVARSRYYQGFLGWSAWLFPISYIATAVGLLLFIVNLPFAFTMFGAGAFRLDWRTGVIETAGGLPTMLSPITNFTGGFSLGNFTFLTSLPAAGDFIIPSISSHEIGHSLNTALAGGIVLWINAVDENIWPARQNLAYGELLAEGHSRRMPGPPEDGFSVRLWY